MRIKPRCRVCGAPVDYMGELCADDRDYEPDGLDQVVRADTLAMMDRISRDDY